jgi:hypothetical protein
MTERRLAAIIVVVWSAVAVRTVMCWAQKEWTMPAARARAIVVLASKRIVAIRAALKFNGGTRGSP